MLTNDNKFPIRIFINVILIVMLLAITVVYEIGDSRNYLRSVFDIFSRTLQEVGDNNESDAKYSQAIINNDFQVVGRDRVLSTSDIRYYQVRNEFGFNQGLYPNVPANGTLVGFGQPPNKLKENSSRFLILDKIWNNYRQGNQFHNHFVANYQYQYIYSSNIRSHKNRSVYLKDGMINPDRYRNGMWDVYQSVIDKYGFFFTSPYPNLFEDAYVFSAITPLYYKGKHFADIGTDITLNELQSIIHLYSNIRDSIQVDLVFNHTSISVPVSEAKYSLFDIYHYTYSIPNLGTIVAHYDISYFVGQLFPIFTMLVLLSVIFHLAWFTHQKLQQERSYLKEQLILDSMTGLYNRRVLDEKLIQCIDKLQKAHLPVAVIAIDANKFKYINDTYGHQVGDNAILHIAHCLTTFTRQQDFCIRMGGDEFLVVLPHLILDKAAEIAERLENEVALSAQDRVGVDISIIAAVTQMEPDENFDQVYRRVDHLLYVKKGPNAPR